MKTKVELFEEVRKNYLDNVSDKHKLKIELFQQIQKDPTNNSDLFALFILNSKEPFYFLSGATYFEFGKHVESSLFKKVCLHLLENLENTKDAWIDIQQIGRWVGQDFTTNESSFELEQRLNAMSNKMMDYFEERFSVE